MSADTSAPDDVETRAFAAALIRDYLAETTDLNYGDRNRVAWGLLDGLLASDWLALHDAAVAVNVLREFGEDCGRSIEAMATASQYGPHRRAGMRDAAARVQRRANEFAYDIESESRR